ncbi:MAG: carboxypeptidase-like regulatory domain-containing protein [Planctomycetota bacterium]
MTTKMKVAAIGVLFLVSAAALIYLIPGSDLAESPSSNEDLASAVSEEATSLQTIDSDSSAFQVNEASREIESVKPISQTLLVTGSARSDDEAAGIENATVTLIPLPPGSDAQTATGTTDSTGQFYIQWLKPDDSFPSNFLLCIQAEGFLDFETSFPLVPGLASFQCGSFVLTTDQKYPLHVMDKEGKPIAAARLIFYKEGIPSFQMEKITDQNGYTEVADSELLWGGFTLDQMYLHVIAPNLVDTFIYFCRGSVPNKVVMESEGYWTGRVVDKETGSAIRQAEVFYETVRGLNKINEICPYRAMTDDSGEYRLPRISYSSRPWLGLSIFAKAEGYLTGHIHIPLEESPKPIRLKKVKAFHRAQAIDASTGKPLSHLEITVKLGKYAYTIIATDENGTFLCPQYDSLELEAAFHETAHLNRPDQESPLWTIPFRPFIRKSVDVRVLDELGRPVPGAEVWLEYARDFAKNNYLGRSIFTSCKSTDLSGFARILPKASSETNALLRVVHPGYFHYISDYFPLGEDRKIPPVVLKRGTLFQKIHITDHEGKPAANQKIIGEIILPEGRPVQVRDKTDAMGRCAMAFPPFKEGYLQVRDRPDTEVALDFDSLLKQEGVEIVIPKELAPSFAIRGVIQNEAGEPLSHVEVKLVNQQHTNDSFPWFAYPTRKTDKYGSFSFLANKNVIYRLEISPSSVDRNFYISEPFTDLKAGDDLKIVMTSSSGISVRLYAFREKYGFIPLTGNMWLEDETGKRLAARPVPCNKDALFVFSDRLVFKNIQPGNYRVAGKSDQGKIRKTPFFEVQAGRCVSIPLKNSR